MAITKPSIPKGTRDFSPEEMRQRNFIFDTLKEVFQLNGYLQIETPAMENLSTLLGKYGDEGDKLLFKILNSGDFWNSSINEVTTDIDKALLKFLTQYYENRNNLVPFFKDIKKGQFGNISIFESFIEYFVIKNSEIEKHLINNNFDQFLNYFKTHRLRFLIDFVKDKIEQSSSLPSRISEKGLRYDLTVPFARYVVQHREEITFPFKRFQIQPVWRADKPQKGRYREFYQCDVDVVGSDSLLNEAELIQIIDEGFRRLGIRSVIKLNNRKILSGIAQTIGEPNRIIDITIAIDKIEKIGIENVKQELFQKGLSEHSVIELEKFLKIDQKDNELKLKVLKSLLLDSEIGLKGIEELQTVFDYIKAVEVETEVELDLTLARGLNYYTGAIFEVKAKDVEIGSICGGGRYDNLTGIFGLPDVSGVGISFGADRVFDVLTQLKGFPADASKSTQILFINFGEKEEKYCLPLVQKLRKSGVKAELFPGNAKMKKQMSYADAKKIPYVALVGEEEISSGLISLKNMQTGEQSKMSFENILDLLR